MVTLSSNPNLSRLYNNDETTTRDKYSQNFSYIPNFKIKLYFGSTQSSQSNRKIWHLVQVDKLSYMISFQMNYTQLQPKKK
uniref:Uncharacterized protein n=1 Tax=Rhipicephalus zambeziensis TaxID=60191 RepID=A0A224Y555_9ACAR